MDDRLLVNHEKFPYRAVMSEPFSAGPAVYEAVTPTCPPSRTGSVTRPRLGTIRVQTIVIISAQ